MQRLREIIKIQNQDWSYKTSKKWKGKEVEIESWLFYDWDYGGEHFFTMAIKVKVGE